MKKKTLKQNYKPKRWYYSRGGKRHLTKGARAYLAFRISEAYTAKKRLKLKPEAKYERFSMALIDDKYGITLRAEIVAPKDQPEIVQARLDRFLHSVSRSNAGFKKLDFKPTKLAKERELIDYKEAEASGTLNTMSWSVDK